jgi:hydrogenase-4 component B
VLVSAAAAGLAGAIAVGPRSARWWLALTLASAVAAAGAAAGVLAGAGEWEWRSTFTVGGELLYLRLDGISAMFLMLVSVVGAAGAVYARGYWTEADYPVSARRGRMWWSALLLNLGAVLLASNGLHFLIAWELFTICAFFLITLENRRREVRAAGWLYLVASHTGTVGLFAFFSALAARTGSWELGPGLREQAGLAPLFWLALFGFAVKGGVFPLHVWLPSAHANAPSHVSAILSGVAIKMGVYGLVRFSGWLPLPDGAGWVVMGLGAAGALLGIAFALAQNDLKRLLAYSSVENIGVIMIGLGAALLAATHGDAAWGRLALAGALLHVWNHGLFKPLLFFGAGAVLHATGTREMSRLGGLWRTMPWTAGLFAFGAVAVSALPPLNGFVSEWLIYLGLFDAANARGPLAWATMPAAIVLAMTGALALATFVKAAAMVFLGAPRTQAAGEAHECGPWMRGPMVALAAGCGLLGLGSVLVWPALARAGAAWHPAWSEPAEVASLATLGWAQAGLAAGFGLAAVWLWRRVRASEPRRAPTWDCGYAAPSARMQYTSGSFGGLATGWFALVLRPERTLRRPRGAFPRAALHLERVPEAVLERVVQPVAVGILRVAGLVRRLQHGRLQYYIAYVGMGLAALGTMVLLEGAR